MPDGSRRAADFSAEALVLFWRNQAKKLADAGVPLDRIAISLKVASTEAELSAPHPLHKLNGAIGRLQSELGSADSHSSPLPLARTFVGPERRAPSRPWSDAPRQPR